MRWIDLCEGKQIRDADKGCGPPPVHDLVSLNVYRTKNSGEHYHLQIPKYLFTSSTTI